MDKAKGIISEGIFITVSEQYENDRINLIAEKEKVQSELNKIEISSKNSLNFIKLVKKYTDIPELTTEILHSFISQIVVHERKVKYSREYPTEIDIYFRHIGTVE